jgi:hypothetical protein
MICPRCKENTAHRAERVGFIDNTANRFLFKPYSCGECRHRFYALRRDITGAALRADVSRWFAGYNLGRKGKRNRRELVIYALAAVAIVAVIYYISQQRL